MIEQIIILILIILIFYCINIEGFEVSPNIKIRTEEVLENKTLFGGDSTYQEARNKLKWLDPVTYDDIIRLKKNNNLNENMVSNYV